MFETISNCYFELYLKWADMYVHEANTVVSTGWTVQQYV